MDRCLCGEFLVIGTTGAAGVSSVQWGDFFNFLFSHAQGGRKQGKK